MYEHKTDPAVENLIKIKAGQIKEVEGIRDDAGKVVPEKIID